MKHAEVSEIENGKYLFKAFRDGVIVAECVMECHPMGVAFELSDYLSGKKEFHVPVHIKVG